MKVRAETTPAGTKRSSVPTRAYGDRLSATDLSRIGPAWNLHPPAESATAAKPPCGEKCGLAAKESRYG
jgi:hypothetical protein